MNETLITSTPIFDVVEKNDNGTIGFNPVGINAPDWVSAIIEQDGKYLMVKQLRYGLMHECEEFCSGQVDKGETPLHAVIREIREETGLDIRNESEVKYLGNFAANPAFMNNRMHYFYVNVDTLTKYTWRNQQLDEYEKLTLYWKNKDMVKFDCINNHDSVFMPVGFWLLNKNGFE